MRFLNDLKSDTYNRFTITVTALYVIYYTLISKLQCLIIAIIGSGECLCVCVCVWGGGYGSDNFFRL